MHFLISGGNGQLGLEWGIFLKKREISFKSYGSSEADITSSKQIKQIIKAENPDIVINCAAFTKVDLAEEERTEAELVNAKAVEQLAGLCAEKDIKLVHFSTDYIFPGTKQDMERLPGGYTENHPPAPVNWYGATKLKGEEAIQESGVRHLIIRTSWLCGKNGSNFVKTILGLVQEKPEIDVVNDQWGSPSFAENVVSNTFNLLQKGGEGIFNVTSEGLITWYQLAKEIFAIKNKEIIVNPVSSSEFETSATRPLFSKLNIQKLKQVNDAEVWDWREGLRKLIADLE